MGFIEMFFLKPLPIKTLRAFAITVLVFLLSLSSVASAAEGNKEKFTDVPQLAALKARIYKSVTARGYVVTTDSKGNIVNTTDATDYEIKDITYNKRTKVAKVILLPKDFSIIITQEWRYKKNDWIFNNQDKAINKLPEMK